MGASWAWKITCGWPATEVTAIFFDFKTGAQAMVVSNHGGRQLDGDVPTIAALPAVMANLDRLDGLGLMGRYGLYEAVDFTASRLDAGTTHAIVRSFMAHHQGMTLVAIADALRDDRS